jgi:hypothetical protein
MGAALYLMARYQSGSPVSLDKIVEKAFAALAARLKPDEAGRAAEHALERLTTQDDHPFGHVRGADLAQVLVKFAERLGPEEAARLCARAAEHTDGLMTQTKDRDAGERLLQAAVKLVERLGPAESARLAQSVLELMAAPEWTEGGSAQTLEQALVTLATRLTADADARMAEQAIDRLAKSTDRSAGDALARGVVVLVERLKPEDAARLCARAARPVIDRIEGRSAMAEVFAALAARLKPDDAAREAEYVLGLMAKTPAENEYAWIALLRTVGQLAERLKPEQASSLCARGRSRPSTG